VSDDPATINSQGIAQIATYAADLVTTLATRSERLTFVSIPRPQVATGDRPWLGSIPDMSGSPGGVRLTGVSDGSPAAAAGMQAGDIITRIGEFEVKDLNDMQNALVKFKPGDVVDVVVRRGDETRTFTVTLGRRG
jgi:S1-C subfamily serine protease